MLIHGSAAPNADKWERIAEVTSGYLHIAGSISSMPAVSVGSVNTGSQSYIFGKSGADFYPLLSTSGTDGGILRVDSSVSVSTGSESYIKGGSIQIYASNIYTGSKGAITSGTNTLLINNVLVGNNFVLTGIDLTGTSDGKFSLNENDKLITQYRTNPAEQNIKRNLNISFTSGGSILVFVEHGEPLSQGFLGAIYGYEY